MNLLLLAVGFIISVHFQTLFYNMKQVAGHGAHYLNLYMNLPVLQPTQRLPAKAFQ